MSLSQPISYVCLLHEILILLISEIQYNRNRNLTKPDCDPLGVSRSKNYNFYTCEMMREQRYPLRGPAVAHPISCVARPLTWGKQSFLSFRF